MKKNRVVAAVCVLALLAGLLSGCGGADTPGKTGRQGTAENEVLTLKEIPEDKMMITMRVEDGMDMQRLEDAIEAQFTGVDIVPIANTACAVDFEHDSLQDIFCATYSGSDKTDYPAKLMDLAGEDFAQNYHANALSACAQGEVLPYLPGPANIYGIVYDKELFAQNGWKVPSSLDEFVALCETISATGIRPLQPALYYTDAVRQLFDGFCYQDVFAGLDNFAWLQSFRAGDTSMANHIEPGLEIMSRLLKSGALDPGDFDIQPGTRSNMMYSEHTCAMILETQMAPIYAGQNGKGREHEIGMMPFYSGGEGSDYLFSVPNFYIGASARLDEPGNEEKRQQVLDILDWISTPEGQQAIIDPETPMISSVKGVPLTEAGGEFLSEVTQTIEKGNVVPQPFWIGNTGSTVDKAFRESLAAWTRGEISEQELTAACDEARDQALVDADDEPELTKLATVKSDFTVLETSLYFAQLFKEEMGADIGLCLSNSRQCGNNVQFYAGDLTVDGSYTLDFYLNRCFYTETAGEDGDRQLQKVVMTGQQLLDALNNPPVQDKYPDCYYVAAGLKIEFAPWAREGNRYVSVTLPDGSALKPDKEYTVALWNGSVQEDYTGELQDQSGQTVMELFTADAQTKGELAPPTDGRFTLNWDTPVVE